MKLEIINGLDMHSLALKFFELLLNGSYVMTEVFGVFDPKSDEPFEALRKYLHDACVVGIARRWLLFWVISNFGHKIKSYSSFYI